MKQLNYLLLITLSMLAVIPSKAQWRPTGGPSGGTVTAIDTFGGFLWAGIVDGGIYKSADNGATWQRADNGIPGDFSGGIRTLLPAQGKLFAGTEGAGLYVTTNMGSSWSYVPAAPWLGNVTAMAGNGSNVVAVVNGVITRSTDNGVTWTQPGTGLPAGGQYWPTHMAAVNGAILIYLTRAGQGFYRSTDNGASWTAVPGPGGYASCDMMRAIGNRIFVYEYTFNANRWIKYSDDGGLTWSTVNIYGTPPFTTDIAISNGQYIITTPTGLMKAPVNGTLAWTDFNGALSAPLPICGVIRKTNGGVFAGTGAEGVIRIDTALTGNVVLSNNGLIGTRISALCGDGRRLLAGIHNHTDLATSVNGGQSWMPDSITNYYHNNVHAIITKGNLWYIGVENMGFQLSRDGGATWRLVNNGVQLLTKNPTALFATAAGVLLAADSNGIYRCVNDTMWTLIATMPDSMESVYHFAAAGNYLFAGTRNALKPTGGNLYRSADNGQSWQIISQNWRSGTNDVYGLAVQGNRIIAGTWNGPYVSTDYGTTWDTLRSGLDAPIAGHVTFRDLKVINGRAYAALDIDETLYELKPDSTVWRNLTPLATDPHVTTIWGKDTVLYVGTSNSGVWKRTISPQPASIPGTEPGLPLSCYPNPGEAPVLTGDASISLPLLLQIVSVAGRVLRQDVVSRLPYYVPAQELLPGTYLIMARNKAGSKLWKWEKIHQR